MSITTSARFNMDTLLAGLPVGVSVAVAGDPTQATAKTVTFTGTDDVTGQAAVTAAAGQFTDRTANQASLQTAVQTRLAQVETFIASNPNGAVLTAAQTNALARMVVALARLTLNLTTTVGQGT